MANFEFLELKLYLVCAMYELITSGKYNKFSVAPLPLFFVFSSEILNSDIKKCFDRVVDKMQFEKNLSIFVFSLFIFSVL